MTDAGQRLSSALADRYRVERDVSPDGRRFVFTRDANQADQTELHVVLHWFDRARAARR